jgi:DNA-binding Lrp family transcriptional regulator
MVTTSTLKNPPKILKALASKTMTMTIWDLSEETKIDYKRVHELISPLEKKGYVKAFGKKLSQRGGKMELYGLTFKGTIAYLASLQLERPTGIVKPGESIEDFIKRDDHEKESYQKKVLEKLMPFLERQGKLLDYALFKEIRWLASRYHQANLAQLSKPDQANLAQLSKPSDHKLQKILEIAYLIEGRSPSATMQLLKASRKELHILKQKKKVLDREMILGEGKIEVTEFLNKVVAEINDEITEVKQSIEILYKKENVWLQREFTSLFAERYSHAPSQGDMHNEALSKLFKQVADDIRCQEVEPLEAMAQAFKGQLT